MAEKDRDEAKMPRQNETRDIEHERVRSSNDRDQALEREGIESEHNSGYDEATRGQGPSGRDQSEDVDPDSAEAEVDRDDMSDEP